MDDRTSPASRAAELDGIRGWASFSVLIFHLVFVVFGDRFLDWRDHAWVFAPFNGPLAVFVFFILSGDALSIGYLRTGERRVIDFLLLRRYFRLMIPVALSTTLVFIAMETHLNFNAQAGQIVRLYDWLSVVIAFEPSWAEFLHYVLLDVFAPPLGRSVVYNPMLWTMPIELAGSLLVFAFWYLSPSIDRPKHLLVALTLALGALGSFYALFFFGMLLSVLRREGTLDRWRGRLAWQWLAPCAAVAAAIVHASLGEQDPLYRHVGLACAMVIVASFHTSRLALAFFRSPPSRWLGDISFPLYLTHFSVLVTFTSWLIVTHQPIDPKNALEITGISALVALLIATLFRQVERHALRTADAMLARLLRRVPR